jgi:hypothetical protein
MKKILIPSITIALIAAVSSQAESGIKQFNELGYGTLSGRLQTLSMYRDYDDGNNNQSTTLGFQLDYLSPEIEGWTIGASYTGAGVLDSMDDDESNPGDRLLANGRVNVLNEGFLSYNLAALGYSNTTATVGRRVNNGEVFRADDFRQKKRSLEAFTAETGDFHKTRILLGHAWKESNMWSTDSNPTLSSWHFQDFGDVFNTAYDTDGVTWGEIVNNCIEDLEVALFDAHAYDVANMFGARAKYSINEDIAVLGYYRNESDVGRANSRHSDVFGLSARQQLGKVSLEGGYWGVHGQNLRFQELTTGINHALGSSLMIYSGQFNGGSDTVYLKAVTTIEQTKTLLYGLYNYTWHDHDKTGFDGQELNVVIKQPVPKIDNLTVCFKGGIGYRDGSGQNSTTATDARLFVTYAF